MERRVDPDEHGPTILAMIPKDEGTEPGVQPVEPDEVCWTP
jgi:hypothetical protein